MNSKFLSMLLIGAFWVFQGSAHGYQDPEPPQTPQDCTPVPPGCFKPELPKECHNYENQVEGSCVQVLCVAKIPIAYTTSVDIECKVTTARMRVGAEHNYLQRVRYVKNYVPGGEAPETGFDKVNCTKVHCLILQPCAGCTNPFLHFNCEKGGDDQNGPSKYTNMVPAGNACSAGNGGSSGDPVPAPEDLPQQQGPGPGEGP